MRDRMDIVFNELPQETADQLQDISPRQARDIIDDARDGHIDIIDDIESGVGLVSCHKDGNELTCSFGSESADNVEAFHFYNADTNGFVNGMVGDEFETTYKSGKGVCYIGHEEGEDGEYISCDDF